MALIKCSECGHEVSDKASMCPNCGCPIKEFGSKKCKECGHDLPDNKDCCPYCGCPVITEDTSDRSVGSTEPVYKRKWILISGVIIGIIAIGVVAFYLFQKNGRRQIALTPELADAVLNYDEVRPFHDGLALVVKDGKYGYINERGEEIIPCQRQAYIYRDGEIDESILPDFSDGMALIYTFSKNEDGELDDNSLRYGYINKNGEEVIPIQYKQARGFSEGWANVTDEDENVLFIDKRGKEVLRTNRDVWCTDGFYNGLALVAMKEENGCGFIDKKGEIAISMKYNHARTFSDGMAYVESDRFKGFIDTKGNELISCSDYYDVGDFHEGLAAVVKESSDIGYKIGFIDKQGKIVIPISLPVRGGEGGIPILETEYFSDGMYLVGDEENGRYFIDKTGKRLFDVKKHMWAMPYSEGLSLVCYRSVYGFIDTDGNNSITEEQIARIDKKLAEEQKRREEEERRYEEEQRRIERERAEAEAREVKSWIEGNWRYRTEVYGSVSEMRLGISGDYIVVMIDGQHYYSGAYSIEGNHLIYNRRNGSSDYLIIDKYNHRLMADEYHPMQRF